MHPSTVFICHISVLFLVNIALILVMAKVFTYLGLSKRSNYGHIDVDKKKRAVKL